MRGDSLYPTGPHSVSTVSFGGLEKPAWKARGENSGNVEFTSLYPNRHHPFSTDTLHSMERRYSFAVAGRVAFKAAGGSVFYLAF